MRKTIKDKPNNYRNIKHPDLKDDLEYDRINGFKLVSIGLTTSMPKTWTIEVHENNVLIDEYIYNTYADYQNDLKILKDEPFTEL